MGFTLRDETFFEQPFVKLFDEFIKSRKLTDRILDIYSAPQIQEFDDNYCIKLTDGSRIDVDGSNFAPEEITTGLAILYGYGFVRPNYLLSIFAKAPNNRGTNFTKDLAVEIWDTRIHIDYMRDYCGHTDHNDSKTLEFCILTAEEKIEEAKKYHRTSIAKGRDSPHHMTKGEFVRHMKNNSQRLFELFDDQASISGRYFIKKLWKPGTAHSNIKEKIMKGGVRLEIGLNDYEEWNEKCFDDFKEIDTDTQKYWWSIWEQSNDNFDMYWKIHFGEFYEHWFPPDRS